MRAMSARVDAERLPCEDDDAQRYPWRESQEGPRQSHRVARCDLFGDLPSLADGDSEPKAKSAPPTRYDGVGCQDDEQRGEPGRPALPGRESVRACPPAPGTQSYKAHWDDKFTPGAQEQIIAPPTRAKWRGTGRSGKSHGWERGLDSHAARAFTLATTARGKMDRDHHSA